MSTQPEDLRWTIALGGLLENRHILDVQPGGGLSHNVLHGILPHLALSCIFPVGVHQFVRDAVNPIELGLACFV